MKVFISQPMNGRSDEEIKAEREDVERWLNEMFDNVVIVDSFFENAPHDAAPLWFLGKSLELLSTADMAFFVEGWENARGCKLEHDAAIAYGIEVISEKTVNE